MQKVRRESGSLKFVVLRNNANRKFSNDRHFEMVKYLFFFTNNKQSLMTSTNGVIVMYKFYREKSFSRGVVLYTNGRIFRLATKKEG